MRFGEVEGFVGRVIEAKGGLIRVDIVGVKTDFIPYLQTFSSFKTSFCPPQKDQQVLVFKLSDVMIAIGDLNKESAQANPNKEITTYSDGTTISYDVSNSTLEINSQAAIHIKAKDIHIECKNAKIKSESIDLGDSGGGNVVTTQCLCAFTGLPHPDGSSKVRAMK